MINRPQPDEYPLYGAKYVELVSNEPILEILEASKESTYNFFINLDPDKACYAYAEGKWTVNEVLGHMIDAERIFAYRALCFSREQIELPGFDQDTYVRNGNFNSRSLEDLANEFRAVRESNLYLFRSLSDEQTMQKGIASGNPISVRGLIYLAAGHELYHIKLLKERYFGEV